jgi:hypothetical protein
MIRLRVIVKFIAKNKGILAYLAVLIAELTAISILSDLSPGTQNWIPKAIQLRHLEIPEDNFYGPGGAILMVPFSFYSRTAYLANYFYMVIGSVGFWNISQLIGNRKLRTLSLASLPANFYLLWLIDSSQDTVFEFALLTWSMFFLLKRRWFGFSFVTFLLCETRAGYWAFFVGISLILFIRGYINSRKYIWSRLVPFCLLLLSSGFNFVNYSSPSPALESGVTAYFSYTKYHYLALPKMDMDVFLSGPDGAFSSDNGPTIPEGSSPSEISQIYQRAAIKSAIVNKKETILGWMQKFDSYIFDVQKIPHLPGSYVLNQTNHTISIGNERLSWQLIIGYMAFEVYRTIWLVATFISIGLFIGFKFLKSRKLLRDPIVLILATPFIFGIIPGMLMYTETRFKIVPELLIVPLVAEIWSRAQDVRAENFTR